MGCSLAWKLALLVVGSNSDTGFYYGQDEFLSLV